MFNTFLGFLVALDLSLYLISTINILAFMEYLAQNGMSPDHIVNYLTAIRSLCIIYNCDTTPFRDQRLLLFIKSLEINRQFNPWIINESLLLTLLQLPLNYNHLKYIKHCTYCVTFHSSGCPTSCLMLLLVLI